MSEVVVAFTAKLVNDEANEIWSTSDITRAVSKQGIRLHYEELIGIETRVHNADSIYLKFQTPRDRQWLDNEFTIYDGEYTVIVPTIADVENGIFEFATEPITPVTIITTSYCPYLAASDLLLESANKEAGDVSSFSTQNGSFTYTGAGDIRSQAMAYKRKGRKVFSV